MGKGCFDRVMKRFAAGAGFDSEGLTFYSSRYTLISAMWLSGMDPKRIAVITNHTSNAVESYIHSLEKVCFIAYVYHSMHIPSCTYAFYTGKTSI